jgi:rhodanese-related sulfurtransferase
MEKPMKRVFLLLAIAAVALTACQGGGSEKTTGQPVAVDGGSYTNVGPDELNTMLENKDFVFVNVHIPFEGDIADTDLSIPYDQVTEAANLAQLPADKDAKVVLYCRSGRMSAIAAEALLKEGYTNLWNLDGGMVAWEQAGYPIER